MAKYRQGFVSNSSSTSFMITNKSDKTKSIIDFAIENIHLVDEFNSEYNWHNYTYEDFLNSASQKTFKPFETKECIFGDEDGTVMGTIFDYKLRDGGQSENWKWTYYESLR